MDIIVVIIVNPQPIGPPNIVAANRCNAAFAATDNPLLKIKRAIKLANFARKIWN